MDVSQSSIDGLPGMYYIADFITEAEEEAILNKIPSNRWTSLTHRRLQAIPTQLTTNNVLLATGLPDWLTNPSVQRIESLGFFRDTLHGVNHCLVNEYLPGQGIMPHEDGTAYHPVVATVSLGGTLVLNVTAKIALDNASTAEQSDTRQKSWRIVQEPRSLLVTTDPAYTETLHGIADVEEDIDLNPSTVANWSLLSDAAKIEAMGGRSRRTSRISLTFRDVKKVSKLGNRLLGSRS